MLRPLFFALALGCLLAAPAAPSCAAGMDADPAAARPVREGYTKYEYRIPMRDGVRLFTTVYVPKDAARAYPFLMQRTPYSAGVRAQGELRYGVDWMPESLGPSREFEQAGYIFVSQDVRGRYMSEGVWQEMTPHGKAQLAKGEGRESEDMYDTVAWLLTNIPNNNGKVGIWGISYPGFYAAASVIDSHPAPSGITYAIPVRHVQELLAR